jgi:uncharacterized membrane protein YphA (DoxX/SURF4 family)
MAEGVEDHGGRLDCMRVWLGAMWIQAGAAKLWGPENPGFLHNNGVPVAGFAAHGVPAYTWWGSFLHNFVVPNAGWIAILVAVAEFTIGVALVAGCFTRIAALGTGSTTRAVSTTSTSPGGRARPGPSVPCTRSRRRSASSAEPTGAARKQRPHRPCFCKVPAG